MTEHPNAPETLESHEAEAAEEQPQPSGAQAEQSGAEPRLEKPPASEEQFPGEEQPAAEEQFPGEEQLAAAQQPAGEDAEADHEQQLEQDIEQLTAKASKADEYLELAQRTKADFENYRKRAAREAAASQERGVAKLAKELLPAVDNLDRALAATDAADDSDTLASGIKLVHADVIAALARVGIEPYSPQGEQFDPQHHEAVAQQPVDGAQPGTIVEVYQRGYRIGEAVLRPARVVVAA